MSKKEAVLELVNRLPNNVTLREILREIEFVAAVKEGLEEIDRGQGISIHLLDKLASGK